MVITNKLCMSFIRENYHTVCSGSSDPFYIASLLYKMGHYFLDILYKKVKYAPEIRNMHGKNSPIWLFDLLPST